MVIFHGACTHELVHTNDGLKVIEINTNNQVMEIFCTSPGARYTLFAVHIMHEVIINNTSMIPKNI